MTGVLLLAHGTPDALDQMPEYLTRVGAGRPPAPELLEQMRHNYAAIGGRSPLTELTLAQAAALAAELGDGTPVYVGMRNWHPFIADTLARAERDGVRALVALPLAPQYASVSFGKYRAAVEAATPPGLSVRFVEPFYAHPGLLEAFAENVRAALRLGPCEAVVFTAHSVPLRLVREGDPYTAQVEATARGVAERVDLRPGREELPPPAGGLEYFLAWQSAGRTPEPWLRPSLEERLARLAEQGRSRVLVAPVGFVCDHTEVLYDLDVQARAFARERGIDLRRSASLNTSPTFIRALADLVKHARG